MVTVLLAPVQGFATGMLAVALWNVWVKFTAPAPSARAKPIGTASIHIAVMLSVKIAFLFMLNAGWMRTGLFKSISK